MSTLQAALTTGYWTDYVKYLYSNYMLDGETVSIYLEDNSSYFSDEHVAQMKNIVSEIDGRIDLDFEFTNDLSASDIDIFLGDRTYQEYLGLATVQEGWISLDVLGEARESTSSNLNTFTHEFLHALGIGEPGFNPNWNQDYTVMSYNPGASIEWRTSPGTNDYAALISLWGHEDDFTSNSFKAKVVPGTSNVNPPPPHVPGNIGLGDSIFGKEFRSSEMVDSLTDQINFNRGLVGDNYFLGSAGDDTLVVFTAEAGSWVNGNRGVDTITGMIDGVTYRGGADNDILQVSAGTVWGDKGADTFQAVAGEGVAVVQDFTVGEDFLQGIIGGSFTLTEQGLSYGVGGDQMLLLAGITDASQVTLI